MQRLRRCLDATLARATPPERALPRLYDGLRVLAGDAAAPRVGSAATAIDRYRRISLADSTLPRYSALAIVWPPGHVGPLHDHGGLWGIQIVLSGALDTDEYDVLAPQRVRRRHGARLTPGEGTWFGGRRFAHACRNASQHAPALSLHVYGGDLVNYLVYAEDGSGLGAPGAGQPVTPEMRTAQRHDANLIVE